MEKQIEEAAETAKNNLKALPKDNKEAYKKGYMDALSQQYQQPDSKDLEGLRDEIEKRFPSEIGQIIVPEGNTPIDEIRLRNYYRRQGAMEFLPKLFPQSNPVVDTDEFPHRDELFAKFELLMKQQPTLWDFDDVYMLFHPYLTNTSDGDKWVSVEERLPEIFNKNILAVTNKNKTRITWMDMGLKRLDPEEIDEALGEYYTHWMPLPSPPINK